jgi:tetratricopeptide (TPR) repeat protein
MRVTVKSWRPLILPILLLLAPSGLYGQTAGAQAGGGETAVEKLYLASELRAIEAESAKLDKPLAVALAKAEIADAAWSLDNEWAKQLLSEAYELTFPEEKELEKLRDRPVGAPPSPPTDTDLSRDRVRDRVFGIAGRDKGFADGLLRVGQQKSGRFEEHVRNSGLARKSIEAGDYKEAGDYILKSIEADPTQINAGFSILDMAARDRAAADKLTLQYIERLRAIPLSVADQSAIRVYLVLSRIVFPVNGTPASSQRVPPAGPAVVRAYVSYVIESMSRLEQREPGGTKVLRPFLLSAWQPLQRNAPELAEAFLELDRLSRRPDDGAALPAASGERARAGRAEEQVKRALDSGKPDDLTINFALSRGDFAGARKMLDLLPDGEGKTRLAEAVNSQEAASLARRGETIEAERLARRLTKGMSILQVYSVLIDRCDKSQDPSCAPVLVNRAREQLKGVADQRDVPLALSRLAKTILPANEVLALEVLDEAVAAANAGGADTAQAQVGLELDIFRVLAGKNEVRARQAAGALKNSLQRLCALAAVYQYKARELTNRAKVSRPTPAVEN